MASSPNRRYLVGLDESEEAERALEYAFELAADTGASVTITHVVSPDEYAVVETEPLTDIDDAFEAGVVEGLVAARRQADTILENAVEWTAQNADGDIDVETVVLFGDPVDELIRAANSERATAILVGGRGQGSRPERLLGSVARDLVELSPITVTVVR